MDDDPGGRVDTPQSLRHDLRLPPPHGPVQGMQLPIDIGETDIVEIDDGNRPDAGTADSFGGKAADPSQAEDCYGRVLQPPEPFGTDKELCSGKAMENIKLNL